MNVVHLITILDFGGAPRGVLELIAELDKQGDIQQRLIVLGPDTQSYPQARQLVPPPQYLNYRLRHSDWFGIRSAVRTLRSILVNESVDILHTHLPSADLLGALACQGTRCRHLSHISGTCDWIESSRWSDRLKRYCYHKAFLRARTQFVAVSQFAADYTRTGFWIPPDRIQVVMNAIDPLRFPEKPSAMPSHPGTIRIGGAGRFVAEKGFTDLIAAVGRLSIKYPHLQLTIAGQGGLQAEYEEAITTWNLREKCQLVPPLEDMNTFFRDLDIFVLPSTHAEGLSRALMEAMYCQRAVVTSRVSGSDEATIHGQTGLIYEPGDQTALADCLEKLILSPELRRQLGEAAGEFATRNFMVKRVAREVGNVYQKLLGDSATSQGLSS